MKKLITGIALLVCLHGFGQTDTVFVSREKLADTLYYRLTTKAPTGYLANKLQYLLTDSLILKTDFYQADSGRRAVSADNMMQWLYEMNGMALDKTALPQPDSVFNTAYSYAGKMDFDEEIIVIPVGIFELAYNSVDEQTGLNQGILGKDVSIWTDLNPADVSIVSTDTSTLAGPLFDYFSSDVMGLVVKSEFFISNTRQLSDVLSLELGRNGRWKNVGFDEVSYFSPEQDSVQHFRIRITYTDSTVRTWDLVVNTPELVKDGEFSEKSSFSPEDWNEDDEEENYDQKCPLLVRNGKPCESCGMLEDDGGNKLKWCYVPSCSGRAGSPPQKPYILITGYRPPMFGQGFKKTWTIYNDWHHNMLASLNGQGYDIFLVKFNIAEKPYQHGMQESAALLERFINELNMHMKTGDYFENIIQGCSMGEDIARLTLLNMEKKHLASGSTAPHHHTRLNISYDANFYGANIPLGYQYQVYSAKYYPSNYLGLPDFFLSTFLYATVNQKTFRELVAYHAAATSDNIFLFPIQKISYTEPTHHWRRQNFLNALNAVDNGENIFPMPVASRNIAISLGKISGKNSDPGTVNPGGFKNAGDYWQNISALGFRFRTGAAKYMPSGQTFQIFRRQLPPVFLNPFQAVCKHEVNVSMMQEIDNAAGSYMNGIGNFISVSDWTFFPITQIWNGRDFYAHKPVVSALGINRNLWPSDGSMTVNVQNLKLMFNKFGLDYNSTDNSIQSDHYGYPNLGRPGDHFKITPFEAIYIDSKVNPHIDLRDDKSDDLDALNDFIFSEAEPWYLGLQNQVVGSRARSNFTYYVRRRARNIIFVGDSVTPSTDVGDYVVEPNVVLDLRAGEAIVLKPGTHFKAGSKVHLKIEFDGCSGSNLAQSSTASGSKGHEDVKERLEAVSDHTREEQNRIRLYPNPSNDGTFSLKSASEAVISTVRIYNMYGIPVHETANIEATEYRSQVLLQTGTYLVQVTVNSKTETLKLIVL